MRISFLFLVTALTLLSCKVKVPDERSKHLNFLGEIEIPYNWDFNETIIGGLSGIDYNPKTGNYVLISDDRSTYNPARFYEFSLWLDDETHQPVDFEFLNVIYLTNENGDFYLNAEENPIKSIDPEDIRYNPTNDTYLIVNEGERLPHYDILLNPSLNRIDKLGKFIGSFQLPKNLEMHDNEAGPHRNETLESVTYSSDYKKVYTATEEGIYEDGPVSTINNPSWTRIYEFDSETGTNTAQYAYQVEKVKFPPEPADAFSVNGIAAMLSSDDNQLWVVERSYSTGRVPCTIRVFLTDISKATNVKDVTSLVGLETLQKVKKELILDMDVLGRHIDNIEGITYGPDLPNGNKTLIFIADNNFSESQKSQILVFEIIDRT